MHDTTTTKAQQGSLKSHGSETYANEKTIQMNRVEPKTISLPDKLFFLFFVVLVVLKLIGGIHISWTVLFFPIWSCLIAFLTYFSAMWIYFETLGKLFKNDDGPLFLLLSGAAHLSFIGLYFFSFFYVLNAIFQWVDLPKIPNFSLSMSLP